MGGVFGSASRGDAVPDVYYGTDYHSHLGTRRGGMVVRGEAGSGIPDSGVGHAIGYASARRLPYRRPFVKYTPTWPRSFMPQDQHVRDLVAKMKLIPIGELIVGQRLLFCEDSIVRGTQLRDIITRLYGYGAREVHMRPACPPLVFSCKFLNLSRSRSVLDLAGRKAILEIEGDAGVALDEYANPKSERYARMVEVIRKHLGLTTLKYQELGDMIAAIGLPRERPCTYCWDGAEPCPARRAPATDGRERRTRVRSRTDASVQDLTPRQGRSGSEGPPRISG